MKVFLSLVFPVFFLGGNAFSAVTSSPTFINAQPCILELEKVLEFKASQPVDQKQVYEKLVKDLVFALEKEKFSSPYFQIQTRLQDHFEPLLEMVRAVSQRQVSQNTNSKPKKLEELETLLFGVDSEQKLLNSLDVRIDQYGRARFNIEKKKQELLKQVARVRECRVSINHCSKELKTIIENLNQEFATVKNVESLLQDQVKILDLLLENLSDWLPSTFPQSSVITALNNKRLEIAKLESYFLIMSETLEKIIITADQVGSNARESRVEFSHRLIIKAQSLKVPVDLQPLLVPREDDVEPIEWKMEWHRREQKSVSIWGIKEESWNLLKSLPLTSAAYGHAVEKLQENADFLQLTALLSVKWLDTRLVAETMLRVEKFAANSEDDELLASHLFGTMATNLLENTDQRVLFQGFNLLFEDPVFASKIPKFIGYVLSHHKNDKLGLALNQSLRGLLEPLVDLGVSDYLVGIKKEMETTYLSQISASRIASRIWTHLFKENRRITIAQYLSLSTLLFSRKNQSVNWVDTYAQIPDSIYNAIGMSHEKQAFNASIFFAVVGLRHVQILGQDNISEFETTARENLKKVIERTALSRGVHLDPERDAKISEVVDQLVSEAILRTE